MLRTPARLGESVCTLCLPREGQTAGMEVGSECTVTGYGRPTDSPVLARGADYWADTTTDGVLREANLSIREADVCTDYVRNQTGSNTNMTSLLCAGGQGDEKACYVSEIIYVLLSRYNSYSGWNGRRQPPVLCPPIWPPFLGRHRVLGQWVWSRNCSQVQQIILSFKTLKPFQPSVSSHG